MRRILLIVIGVLALVLLFLLISKRNAPPEVPFTKVMRETVVSTLATNGKVEPIEWASARSETEGSVERVFIARGQRVAKGTPLVKLDSKQADSDLASAQARVNQVKADLETLRQGGRAGDVSAIDASMAAARQEMEAAQRDYDTLKRLQARSAATGFEVNAARERVERAQVQIQGLQQRRSTLVGKPDVAAAEARLREAEVAVKAARDRLALTVIPAPVDGTVYEFDVKAGAYLSPGDLVANIGKLERVRVAVYVDEPDLGRVSVGMPVSITWDAMPGREWKGVVEQTASEVVPLGTRQVGKVTCIIANPDRELLPGTNVNAVIQSKVVQNALTIPKGAVRRESDRTGVYLLDSDRLKWRAVTLGVASASKTQVTGVNEGESVALPTDRPLKDQMQVTPVYP